MQSLLRRCLGVPATAERRAHAITTLLNNRTPADAYAFMFTVMSHNTGKAGALLAAQGMFAVVGTYGMEHGWAKALVLPSMLLLMIGALLAMSILRSTMGAFAPVKGIRSRCCSTSPCIASYDSILRCMQPSFRSPC